ncbi:MAG: hypothetical protein V4558_15900 [Gemmatimonadota bacterium]
MRLPGFRLASALLLLAVLGCGDSPTEATGVDLTGTWTATAIVATNKANPSQTSNVYAGGLRFSVTFNANNSYTQTLTNPGSAPQIESGSYAATSTSVTFTRTSPSPITTTVLAFTRVGNVLTITSGDSMNDFGSGPVPATLVATLSK